MNTTKLLWLRIVGRIHEKDEHFLKYYLKKNQKYFEAPVNGFSALPSHGSSTLFQSYAKIMTNAKILTTELCEWLHGF